MLDYIDDFRAADLIKQVADNIRTIAPSSPINIMEVCGGHTITIQRYNLASLLPSNINLISGPGCPVCVTATEYIDYAIALSHHPDVIIATFGDLIRVPGSASSLLQAQSEGADIRICYSPAEALSLALANPNRQVVFLAIGFETTAPLIAATVISAYQQKIANFSILSALKTMPAVMRTLLDSKELNLHGFICPGHVSTITGIRIYDFIAAEYHLPCVVTGFEPLDLIVAIWQLTQMLKDQKPAVVNQYHRVVKPEGNLKAQTTMYQVFAPCDSAWRGLGIIPNSGLRLKDEYRSYDAYTQFPLSIPQSRENPACLCGEVLRGTKKPFDCPLFAKSCNPVSPQGACMVSTEGTCATYYKYRKAYV